MEKYMRKNCALVIEEASGEGRVELGEKFTKQDKLFKLDVLGDWFRDLCGMFDDAREAVYPGQKALGQRFANWRRRRTCETLAGLTIQKAEPLANGDVMVCLSDGRILVFKAETEGVDICEVLAGDEDKARQHAESRARTGYFTDEPSDAEFTPEQKAL